MQSLTPQSVCIAAASCCPSVEGGRKRGGVIRKPLLDHWVALTETRRQRYGVTLDGLHCLHSDTLLHMFTSLWRLVLTAQAVFLLEHGHIPLIILSHASRRGIMMFIMLISQHSYCESSPCSYEKCWQVATNPQTKSSNLGRTMTHQ